MLQALFQIGIYLCQLGQWIWVMGWWVSWQPGIYQGIPIDMYNQ